LIAPKIRAPFAFLSPKVKAEEKGAVLAPARPRDLDVANYSAAGADDELHF
jgi:hypothetical protein